MPHRPDKRCHRDRSRSYGSGASKTEPAATTGSFPADEADSEPVRVQRTGILRKITIFEDVLIITKECLRIGLLEVEEPVIRDELGSLGCIIEAIAPVGVPVLFEKLNLLDSLAIGVDGRYIRVGYRIDVG